MKPGARPFPGPDSLRDGPDIRIRMATVEHSCMRGRGRPVFAGFLVELGMPFFRCHGQMARLDFQNACVLAALEPRLTNPGTRFSRTIGSARFAARKWRHRPSCLLTWLFNQSDLSGGRWFRPPLGPGEGGPRQASMRFADRRLPGR